VGVAGEAIRTTKAYGCPQSPGAQHSHQSRKNHSLQSISCERNGGIVPTTEKEIAFGLGYISHVCTTVLVACVGISELL